MCKQLSNHAQYRLDMAEAGGEFDDSVKVWNTALIAESTEIPAFLFAYWPLALHVDDWTKRFGFVIFLWQELSSNIVLQLTEAPLSKGNASNFFAIDRLK